MFVLLDIIREITLASVLSSLVAIDGVPAAQGVQLEPDDQQPAAVPRPGLPCPHSLKLVSHLLTKLLAELLWRLRAEWNGADLLRALDLPNLRRAELRQSE